MAEAGLPDEPIPRAVEPPPLAADAIDRITRSVFRPVTAEPADVLFVFGSIHARFDDVARAWRTGRVRCLVLAGGCGPGWDTYGVPIARGMRSELLALGVAPSAIAIQDRSHNTLEDVAFSLALLPATASAARLAFAAKWHHSGRCYLTLRRFFPTAALPFHRLPATGHGVDVAPGTWHADRAARARVYAEHLRIVAYSARGDIAPPGR